jgi:hypothetical protein
MGLQSPSVGPASHVNDRHSRNQCWCRRHFKRSRCNRRCTRRIIRRRGRRRVGRPIRRRICRCLRRRVCRCVAWRSRRRVRWRVRPRGRRCVRRRVGRRVGRRDGSRVRRRDRRRGRTGRNQDGPRGAAKYRGSRTRVGARGVDLISEEMLGPGAGRRRLANAARTAIRPPPDYRAVRAWSQR